MATDGPDPAPCRDDIYRNGEVVLVTASVSSNRMETWVRALALMSGQDVDWHFVGGRAVVKALGDLVKVRKRRDELRGTLDDMYHETARDQGWSDVSKSDRAPWQPF